MAKLQTSLTAAPGATPDTVLTETICFRAPFPLATALRETAAAKQMSLTKVIISRLEGTATRDRYDMATINGLHVAGCALRSLAGVGGLPTAEQQAQVTNLISEMRALVDKLAERIG